MENPGRRRAVHSSSTERTLSNSMIHREAQRQCRCGRNRIRAIKFSAFPRILPSPHCRRSSFPSTPQLLPRSCARRLPVLLSRGTNVGWWSRCVKHTTATFVAPPFLTSSCTSGFIQKHSVRPSTRGFVLISIDVRLGLLSRAWSSTFQADPQSASSNPGCRFTRAGFHVKVSQFLNAV